MSSRTHRKALPLDPRGIHWGLGERHESGTLWEPDEWKRFVTWACENGARINKDVQVVEWCSSCEDPWGHGRLHREDGPAQIWSSGHQYWFLNGIEYTDGTFAVEIT